MLRDNLARERTMLANERTLLAYVRTSIILAVSGVTVLKLLGDELHFLIIGIVLIPVAIFVALFGYFRFSRMRARIEKEGNPEPVTGVDS